MIFGKLGRAIIWKYTGVVVVVVVVVVVGERCVDYGTATGPSGQDHN
jgi:preprotein translocase subunit SecE